MTTTRQKPRERKKTNTEENCTQSDSDQGEVRNNTLSEQRAEAAAAMRAALPDGEKIADVLEKGTMSMQEIADHFGVSTVKIRPALQAAINSGHIELRNHRYMLGPMFDPRQTATCAPVALQAVLSQFMPGKRATAAQVCTNTGLQRATVETALQQLERENVLSSSLVLRLRLYELITTTTHRQV